MSGDTAPDILEGRGRERETPPPQAEAEKGRAYLNGVCVSNAFAVVEACEVGYFSTIEIQPRPLLWFSVYVEHHQLSLNELISPVHLLLAPLGLAISRSWSGLQYFMKWELLLHPHFAQRGKRGSERAQSISHGLSAHDRRA